MRAAHLCISIIPPWYYLRRRTTIAKNSNTGNTEHLFFFLTSSSFSSLSYFIWENERKKNRSPKFANSRRHDDTKRSYFRSSNQIKYFLYKINRREGEMRTPTKKRKTPIKETKSVSVSTTSTPVKTSPKARRNLKLSDVEEEDVPGEVLTSFSDVRSLSNGAKVRWYGCGTM